MYQIFYIRCKIVGLSEKISHLKLPIFISVGVICVQTICQYTVYPKKYAHGFVVLCFVVVTQSFKMNSHEVFIHIHQGCFAGTAAIVRLPQCQWSKPDGYGKISQCIITTKHSKAKTVCKFLGIYCMCIIIFLNVYAYHHDPVWIKYHISAAHNHTCKYSSLIHHLFY